MKMEDVLNLAQTLAAAEADQRNPPFEGTDTPRYDAIGASLAKAVIREGKTPKMTDLQTSRFTLSFTGEFNRRMQSKYERLPEMQSHYRWKVLEWKLDDYASGRAGVEKLVSKLTEDLADPTADLTYQLKWADSAFEGAARDLVVKVARNIVEHQRAQGTTDTDQLLRIVRQYALERVMSGASDGRSTSDAHNLMNRMQTTAWANFLRDIPNPDKPIR